MAVLSKYLNTCQIPKASIHLPACSFMCGKASKKPNQRFTTNYNTVISDKRNFAHYVSRRSS